jgi:hypothetical protein
LHVKFVHKRTGHVNTAPRAFLKAVRTEGIRKTIRIETFAFVRDRYLQLIGSPLLLATSSASHAASSMLSLVESKIRVVVSDTGSVVPSSDPRSRPNLSHRFVRLTQSRPFERRSYSATAGSAEGAQKVEADGSKVFPPGLPARRILYRLGGRTGEKTPEDDGNNFVGRNVTIDARRLVDGGQRAGEAATRRLLLPQDCTKEEERDEDE